MNKEDTVLSAEELEKASGGLPSPTALEEYATKPCPKCGKTGKKVIKRFGKAVLGGKFTCEGCGNKFD